MPETLQTQFRAAIKQAENLQTVIETEGYTPERGAALDTAIKSAQVFKDQIEKSQMLDAVKKWRDESAGSAVRSGFIQTEGVTEGGALQGWSGEALRADEGTIPGINAENVREVINPFTGRKSYESGEMYATSGVGEAKLKALKSGAYKDAFREYLVAAARGTSIKSAAMKVLEEGVDTSGGFWAPPDIRAELVKKMAGIVNVRNNAFAFTTGSNMVTFPKVVYTTDDIYTAGTKFAWTAEAPANDISESTNPAAGKINIPIHTATAAVILTRSLIEDNQFDILGYISQLLGEAFGLGEDDAFIEGDGSGKPQGILSHPNATVATASGGMLVKSGVSAKFTWQGVVNSEDPTLGLLGIEAALPPQYENNAKWYAAKSAYGAIRGITDTQKRPLWSIGESFPSFQNGYSATLLGYPTVKDQFVPAAAASSTSLIFGDLMGYYIADRVGLSVEVLREVRALKDEVVVYARKRVGGLLAQDWRVKVLQLAA